MKTVHRSRNWVLGLLMVAVMGGGGCGKSSAPDGDTATERASPAKKRSDLPATATDEALAVEPVTAAQGPTTPPAAKVDANDPFVVAALENFAGRYVAQDGQASLHLRQRAGALAGTVVFKGQAYEVTAVLTSDGAGGEFGTGGDRWPFTLASDGKVMTFRSDSAVVKLQRKALTLPPGIYKSDVLWLVLKGRTAERTGLLRFRGREYPFTGQVAADEFTAAIAPADGQAGFSFLLTDTETAAYQFQSGPFRANVTVVTGRAMLDDPTLPEAYADEEALQQKRTEEAAALAQKQAEEEAALAKKQAEEAAALAKQRAAEEAERARKEAEEAAALVRRKAEEEARAAVEAKRARVEAAIAVIGRKQVLPELGLTLRVVEPGTFQMGGGPLPYESPARTVTITRPFWLGETEVTQKQWTAVCGTTPSTSRGVNYPVENVSWFDAMQFCRALTAREQASGRLPVGYIYTLPSEAQWEYACRAGTTGDFAGDLESMAWYLPKSGGFIHVVGELQPNAWGFYDMHGNVWEWTADRLAKYFEGAVSDPTGPATEKWPAIGEWRIYRGGCYESPADECRSSHRRHYLHPKRGADNVGFRLALVRVEPVVETL